MSRKAARAVVTVLAPVLAAAVVASCSDDGGARGAGPGTTGVVPVEGTWVLTATDPSSAMDELSVPIRLELAASGIFFAYDRCNTISSEWSQPERHLVRFTDEKITQIGCDRPDVLPWPIRTAEITERGNLLVGVGGDTVFAFSKR